MTVALRRCFFIFFNLGNDFSSGLPNFRGCGTFVIVVVLQDLIPTNEIAVELGGFKIYTV